MFPRTMGNTGNSQELLGNWSLAKVKILNVFITAIAIYAKQRLIKQPFI